MSELASWPTGVKDVLTRLMQATTPGNTVVQTTLQVRETNSLWCMHSQSVGESSPCMNQQSQDMLGLRHGS